MPLFIIFCCFSLPCSMLCNENGLINPHTCVQAVDTTWRRSMEKMAKNPEVLAVCSDDELLKALLEANKLLDAVQVGTCALSTVLPIPAPSCTA